MFEFKRRNVFRKKQVDFLDTDFKLVKRVMFDDCVPKYEWRNPDEHKPSYEKGYLGKRYLYLLFVYKKKRLFVLLEEEYYLCPINSCYHTNRKE